MARAGQARSFIMNQIRNSPATNRLVWSALDCSYRTAVWGVILSAILTLVACVSVRVEPLTHEVYPPQASPESVQWLKTEPDSPHIKLARIIATSPRAQMRTRCARRFWPVRVR